MRCQHCPVKPGRKCIGEIAPPVCRDVAAGMPGRAEQLIALASATSGPVYTRHPRTTPKVRVGALAPILYPGGAEAMLLSLIRSTRHRLDWKSVIVTGDHPDDPAVAAQLGELVSVGRGLAEARRLASEVDILVTYAIERLAEILEGVMNPPKVISIVHAPPGDPWGDLVYARHQGIDRWVAVSELALGALPAASLDAAPSQVIWNAVDTERLAIHRGRDAMRRAWGVPEDVPVAGFYQRLSPEKDPLAAIRLVGAIAEPWHVVVVGRGPLGEQLHRANNPRLHVLQADPRSGDVLNAFDVLVVASLYESFGLTMAEGLWSGVPLVSTPVGLAKIHPGLTLTVPIGADGAELAEAVKRAYRLGSRPGSQSFARSRLAPSTFGRRWARLIEREAGPFDANDPILVAMRADQCVHGQGPCRCEKTSRICNLAHTPRAVFRADCLKCPVATLAPTLDPKLTLA